MTTYTRPTDEAMAAAEAIRQDAAARVERIRGQDRLRPEVRKSQIARLFPQVQAKMEKLAQQSTAAAEAQARRHSQAAFGIDDLAGSGVERAAVSISFRDAQDRVARLSNVREAEELLRRAEVSGDELLARAIAERAYTQRAIDASWETPLNSYLDSRPFAQQAVAELLDATGKPGIAHLLAFALPEPDELQGLRPDQVQALAEQYPEVG